MSFIAAAIIGAVGVGAGALITSNAAKGASRDARATATENNALASQIRGENVALERPFIDRGTSAGNALSDFLGLGAPGAQERAFAAFRSSPGYQFGLDQGTRAITGSNAAKGLLNSGATLKALQRYGQGYADQQSGNYLSRLSDLYGTGLSAANALSGVNTNYVNQVTANNDSAATASANARLAGAGQINSLLGAGANVLGTLYGSSYRPAYGPAPPF